MKVDYYISLIQKQLAGEITPAEQRQLDEWLGASAENKRVQKTVQKAWELSAGFSQEVELDLEADFEKIEQRLDPIKNEAKIRPLLQRRWILRIAAAFLVLVVGRYVLNNYLTPAVKYEVVTTNEEAAKNPVELLDGSKIWLNAHSKLTYFTTAVSKERRIKIEGEAFFDVTKDASKPFVVELPNSEVTVLGTSFSVTETPDNTIVNVATGKVKLSPKNSDQAITMQANERGVFSKKENQLKKEKLDDLNDLAWHSQKLSFNDTPLNQVIQTISSHYKTPILLENKSLASCPISATFDQKPIGTVIETLAIVMGAEIGQSINGDYLLTGGSCE